MSRLIDADVLYEEHTRLAYEGDYAFHITARAWLEKQPTVDAVPVVRCEDCRYWDREWKPNSCDGTERYCPMIDLETEPDFFCKCGTRKEVHTDEPLHL